MRTIVASLSLLFLLSCKGPQKTATVAVKNSELETTGWLLLHMDKFERPVTPDGRRLSLRMITPLNNATGFSGCNDFTTKFSRENDRLVFSQATATQIVCNEIKMEKRFMELLLQTNRYEIKGKVLTLYKDKTILLVFEDVS